MNIAMEQTEEYVNGQLKNKYGDAFIRGNNGTFDLLFFFSCIYWPSFASAAVHRLMHRGSYCSSIH